MLLPAVVGCTAMPLSAQSILERVDRMLSANYRKVTSDTAYVTRPTTDWTVTARLNVSGATIETEGTDMGQHFKSQMVANSKATLSLGVGYHGITLSLGLNPAKMMDKYQDFELNFNCYRRNFGFDVIYQDAKNFTGWYDQEGLGRFSLPDGMLKVQTLNLNAYYAFNNRRFSYPAAFSQSYIQHRSADSFLLAASYMAQRAKLGGAGLQAADPSPGSQELKLKMNNVGIGAGYGYNYVPARGWLLHLSALPTLVVYSPASLTFGDDRTKLHYQFPETIITGRGAVVRNWSNKFLGLSMVYNYTSIGDRDNFSVYNTKWRIRTFFGVRL